MKHHFKIPVSCKAALFNQDYTKVLLSEYSSGNYGLPGGHMEDGETPDQAMARELWEELGLKNVELTHGDFLVHHNGKLVLAYTGTIDEATPMRVQVEELRSISWCSVDAIASEEIIVGSYRDFILKSATQINVGV